MKNKKIWLFCALAFQIIVLMGIYIKAALPLYFGEEIIVNTRPVDPRSLFRGNYARLNYDFSRLEYSKMQPKQEIRKGEVLYVSLVAKDGVYHAESFSMQRPESGIYLRGRSQSNVLKRSKRRVSIRYGIEAFFASPEKAIALEEQLRDDALAVLMVSSSGQVRVKSVIKKTE